MRLEALRPLSRVNNCVMRGLYLFSEQTVCLGINDVREEGISCLASCAVHHGCGLPLGVRNIICE